jgi:hypothetical protein
MRYWTFVRIDAAGKRKIEEIAELRAFFLESFPEFTGRGEVPDAPVQRQLLYWMKDAGGNANRRFLAERCLECFISHQIERVCQQLEMQFGTEHGFSCRDLFPLVLDDGSKRRRTSATTQTNPPYQSLLRDILQSFDPEQSSLATWATRRVKHHRELNNFLLERGVYLVSDWAILNDTRPKQLDRIFSQIHQLTPIEIQQAKQLLESYHAVYRAQRMIARQAGIKGQCLPPTTEQLQQIAQRLFTQTNQLLSPETLMIRLQEMASRLREYRIYVRGGSPLTESLEATYPNVTADLVDNRNPPDEQTEFLSFYRKDFLTCLDRAVARVTDERVAKLQRQDKKKAQNFLTALQLFHCQERSMTEIARVLNLQAQFHVSRLLKLKSFRADVRQQLLVLLRDRVFDRAKTYLSSQRLQSLNQQIEEALDEQITRVIQEAATEASTATGARNQTISSLFTQRLCRHLDARKNNND